MKKVILYTLVVPALFMALNSCSSDEPGINLPPNTLKVSNVEGIVGYWGQYGVNKYSINVSVPGTYDSQIVGLVDNLPSEFSTEGLVVIFSGEYEESDDNPDPAFGGQSIYSLTLSSIKKK